MAFEKIIETITYIINNNSGIDFILAISIFIGIYFLLFILKKFLRLKIKKTFEKLRTRKITTILSKVFDKLGLIFYFFLPLYVSISYLNFPQEINQKILEPLLYLLILYYMMILIGIILDIFTQKLIVKEDKDENGMSPSLIISLEMLIKIILWSIGLLAILSNLGFDITAIIAGLGIGGIAIAFALQGILADLFASFSLYFDKPFKKGHFIIVGDDMGVVENIGLRSTKINTLRGELLIISNKELTSSRIHNFKKMYERRVVFKIGIEYNTSLEKCKKAVENIKNAIKSANNVRYDRVHFSSYGDFSLNYECVYYVLTPDYNEYMDIQQDINFKIKESFEKDKIEFAFPTQTLYLRK